MNERKQLLGTINSTLSNFGRIVDEQVSCEFIILAKNNADLRRVLEQLVSLCKFPFYFISYNFVG